MEQLIKKKQKKASTLTASTSMDNGKLTGSNLKSSTIGSSQSGWNVKPVQMQFFGGE